MKRSDRTIRRDDRTEGSDGRMGTIHVIGAARLICLSLPGWIGEI
ncbi:hypothetical protein [Bacilliculturomica massiliensis]|nr:hypothetical protein [Bacilliculturomica massiliensis]